MPRTSTSSTSSAPCRVVRRYSPSVGPSLRTMSCRVTVSSALCSTKRTMASWAAEAVPALVSTSWLASVRKWSSSMRKSRSSRHARRAVLYTSGMSARKRADTSMRSSVRLGERATPSISRREYMERPSPRKRSSPPGSLPTPSPWPSHTSRTEGGCSVPSAAMPGPTCRRAVPRSCSTMSSLKPRKLSWYENRSLKPSGAGKYHSRLAAASSCCVHSSLSSN